MSNSISVSKCKKSLALTWLIGSGTIFILFFLQSIMGHYSRHINNAWAWFIPTIIPTLSLIIGVLVADALHPEDKDKTIDPFIFRLALSFSIIYLLLVLMSILIQPFTSLSPLEIFDKSNLWLGPIQGLTSGMLGAFFVNVGRAT